MKLIPLVLYGVPFHNVTFAEALDWVAERMASRVPAAVATANLDFLMQSWDDPELRRLLFALDSYMDIPSSLAGLRLLLIELGAADRNGSIWRGPDGALVLHLPAELTAANVEELRALFEAAWYRATTGARLARVAVDAARLRFIDTSGHGFLAAVRKKAMDHGAEARFEGLQGAPCRSAKLARMDWLLDADQKAGR